MRIRNHLHPLISAVLVLMVACTMLAGPASARANAAQPVAATASATWQWVGWYPDPVLCVFFGASTGRPFECRYTFPWSWDLYVQV